MNPLFNLMPLPYNHCHLLSFQGCLVATAGSTLARSAHWNSTVAMASWRSQHRVQHFTWGGHSNRLAHLSYHANPLDLNSFPHFHVIIYHFLLILFCLSLSYHLIIIYHPFFYQFSFAYLLSPHFYVFYISLITLMNQHLQLASSSSPPPQHCLISHQTSLFTHISSILPHHPHSSLP